MIPGQTGDYGVHIHILQYLSNFSNIFLLLAPGTTSSSDIS